MFLAELTTEHYTWRAAGVTEQEARDLLRRSFIEATSDDLPEYRALTFDDYYADGVNAYALEAGRALRDDRVIIEPETVALGILEPPAWEGSGGVPVWVALNTDGSLTVGVDLSEILEALEENAEHGIGDEVRAAITAALEANPEGYATTAHVDAPRGA